MRHRGPKIRTKYGGTESSPCSRDTTSSTTNNSTPKPDGSSVFRNPWFWANITFTCICFLSFSVCACLKHRPSTVEGSEGARYNMAFFGYADQPPSYSSVVKVKAESEEEETSLRELPPSYDEAIVMWPPPQTAL
nr:hypothetical protein BaRGS_025804 [Batillaria attramentaria]